MTATLIPSHATEQLKEYFSKQKKPFSFPGLFPGVDAALKEVSVEHSGFKFDLGAPFGAAFSEMTSEQRYKVATWKWLRPNEPCLSLQDLPKIQQAVGLRQLSEAKFLNELRYHCDEFRREHPSLSNWVRKRIALLEYKIGSLPPKLPEMVGSESNALFSLVTTITMLNRDPETARDHAIDLADYCLGAAGLAALSALSENPQPWPYNANLMIPVTFNGTVHSQYQQNFETAGQIWGQPNGRCLQVVAETLGTQHLGFWVPLRIQNVLPDIPGAPTAFHRLEGSAVFKDDLPSMDGFPGPLAAHWRQYMTDNFHYSGFISLPLMAAAGHNQVPLAVLNVNVNPPNGNPTAVFRAYHPEWLVTARDRAEPFIRCALCCFLVQEWVERQQNGNFLIDMDIGPWNDLFAGLVPLLEATDD